MSALTELTLYNDFRFYTKGFQYSTEQEILADLKEKARSICAIPPDEFIKNTTEEKIKKLKSKIDELYDAKYKQKDSSKHLLKSKKLDLEIFEEYTASPIFINHCKRMMQKDLGSNIPPGGLRA